MSLRRFFFVLNGVVTTVNGRRRLVTYKEWNDLVQESFEKCYYVPWGKLIFAYLWRSFADSKAQIPLTTASITSALAWSTAGVSTKTSSDPGLDESGLITSSDLIFPLPCQWLLNCSTLNMLWERSEWQKGSCKALWA
jgi:hypothetical protein